MTPEEAKKQLTDKLTELAKVTGNEVVKDLKEYISDGRHDDMKDLAVRALKLKSRVMLEDSKEKRELLARDLEFALARIKTKIETEKIVLKKELSNTVMSALKTALSAFASIGKPLLAALFKSAVKGAIGGLAGGALSNLDDVFAPN